MLKIRVVVVSLFFFALFAVAIARLADLQFNRNSDYAAYRDRRISNYDQRVPRRGRILDADGNILAEDQPTQDLWVTPARRGRIAGRRRVVSTLPPLSTDQMLALAAARGEEREFEMRLARAALVDSNPLVAELAARLELDRETVARRLLMAVAGSARTEADLVGPRPVFPDIDFGLAMEIRAAHANPYDEGVWKAVEIRTGGKRQYPAGALTGHLTGTVGKLGPEEYDQLRGHWNGDEVVPGSGRVVKQGRLFFSILGAKEGEATDEESILRLRLVRKSGKLEKRTGFLENDTVGRNGLEQYYNQALRGRHRWQRMRMVRDEKRGGRRFVPRDDSRPAENGADIRLSLRLDIQRQAHEILRSHIEKVARADWQTGGWTESGVAIMMDPRNGRIHALVSLPSYDPNTLSRDFEALRDDPAEPLFDRALMGNYEPGSVVKPIVGLASLSEAVVMPGQRFDCQRAIRLAGARFTCLGLHGEQDLESALMHSCNIYFYRAGEALGGRRLYEWYSRFGLGHRTGIDIPNESPGLLPRNAFTRRGWATGNTYHMAIGQGITVTPIQIAVAYALLANAEGGVGRVVRPHLLVPPARPPETPAEEELAREALRLDQPVAEIMLDREALAVVRQGLWEVVQGKPETGELGTGRGAAFPLPGQGWLMEIAGKTGTAEWSRFVNGREVKQVSHVWFAAYAPFDRPEIVVVVMLPAGGGGGGGTCAPIAKDLLRMWFNLPERLEIETEKGALG